MPFITKQKTEFSSGRISKVRWPAQLLWEKIPSSQNLKPLSIATNPIVDFMRDSNPNPTIRISQWVNMIFLSNSAIDSGWLRLSIYFFFTRESTCDIFAYFVCKFRTPQIAIPVFVVAFLIIVVVIIISVVFWRRRMRRMWKNIVPENDVRLQKTIK